MILQDFMQRFNNELRTMLFPHSTTMEKVIAGVALAGITYKVGQMVDSYADLVAHAQLIDPNGNIDLPLVEHSVLNGIEWPLTIGNFSFTRADFEGIFARIREGA